MTSNAARAYDEAMGIDTPRMWVELQAMAGNWTAERDRHRWAEPQGDG